VLVIDTSCKSARLLPRLPGGEWLPGHGSGNGQEGILQAAQHPPDVVLLDLGLPDMDGVAGAEAVRMEPPAVVVLSVRDREEDKIAALDHGADDYGPKPFATGELLARCGWPSAIPLPAAEDSVFRSGDLEVDLSASPPGPPSLDGPGAAKSTSRSPERNTESSAAGSVWRWATRRRASSSPVAKGLVT